MTRRQLIGSVAGLSTGLAATRRTAVAAPGHAWMPRISENLSDVEPATLKWLKQMGSKHVIFQGAESVDRGSKGYWTAADVKPIKQRCDEAGIILESLMIPRHFFTRAMTGEDGRDQDIENVIRSIQAVAANGIPMCEWRFKPYPFMDERAGYYNIEGRGGARLKAFDYSRVKDHLPLEEFRPCSMEEMWQRFLYFGKPVVAAAGKANVRLSMHPCDPPVPYMRGVAQIFHHPDGFRRMIREIPSPNNGVTFCQGTFTEMGIDVLKEIRYFGKLGRIHLVHFRAVRGAIPKYEEVFMDEGDVDMLQAMRAFKESGYSGPMVSDHTPKIEGDSPWGHRGRSYSHGYMRALVHAVNSLTK